MHRVNFNVSRNHSGAILTVDLNAICANYRLLRAKIGTSSCSAVLKSDAYGLGARQVATALYREGCRHFFVAHLDEGITLRPFLAPDAEIFVLHGPPPTTEGEFVACGLIPVLNSLEQIEGWRKYAVDLGRTLPAIIQVDSGMSRMGLSPSEVDIWLADPYFLDGITLRFLLSHLACADEPENPMNARQLERFSQVLACLPNCAASLANSSGIFLTNGYHFDLVRPGAALYGIAPNSSGANPMQAVVHLQAKVLQTRTISSGDHVGYSMRYTAKETRRVATVAIGYADGWLRNTSNRGFAIVDGILVPQIGAISMDTVTFDVSTLPDERVTPGSLVDLICPEHSVDAAARLSNTIGYEVLTNLGPRIYRDYKGGLCSPV